MRTEAPGERAAELDLVHGQRVLQGLCVRVDRPELDSLQRAYRVWAWEPSDVSHGGGGRKRRRSTL